jgi:signal transduction histidine kinase/putative methionine-R-sulfoxide reductase with GAF domain
MTARDREGSLGDRPRLLRPLSCRSGAAELVLLAASVAVLLGSFLLQAGARSLVVPASVAVVPVLASAWLGARRTAAAVVALAVALDWVLAARGHIGVPTALARGVVVLGLATLTRVAAVGYAGERAAAARLALVSRVTRIATSASSLEEILRQVLGEMARDGLRGGVILLIDAHHQLYIAAAHGDLDESVRNSRLRIGEGIHGRIVATGRPALVADLDAPDAPPAANRRLGSNARMRSLVAVPLLSAGTAIGVLGVDSSRPNAFDGDDLATLEQIAVAITGSVQRTGALQLADRLLQQRVDELTLLLDTAGRLSMSLELEVIMGEVVRSTAAVVSHGGAQLPPRATVYRIEGEWARMVSVEDDEDHASLPADLPLEEHPFIRRAMASGRVATGRLDQTGPRIAAAAARLGLVSGAWAPIWTGTTLFGILAASSRDELDFEPEELRLLEGIAHLAGLAIGNAQAMHLERERADSAREHAERMAAVEQVKSEFLRLASHELRGPLAVLGGYLSMIDDGSVRRDEFERVLPVLAGKVAEMNRLVDQMLETARLEEGRLRLELERTDLVRLVEDAVHTVLPLGSSRHRVVVDAEHPVPITVDTGRILTVLANLVGNAVKYSPGGGEVRCSVAVEADRAVVRVSDQGIGISAADLRRLFTRFGRVVTPENSHIAGTGLGLYLARELARMHGGDIAVSSQLGQGSTFTLWLPRGEASVLPLRPSDAHDVRPAAEQ